MWTYPGQTNRCGIQKPASRPWKDGYTVGYQAEQGAEGCWRYSRPARHEEATFSSCTRDKACSASGGVEGPGEFTIDGNIYLGHGGMHYPRAGACVANKLARAPHAFGHTAVEAAMVA